MVSTAVAADADESFDQLTLEHWRLHLASLERDGCRSTTWGSNYWKEWLNSVDFNDEIFCSGDVYVAEVEGDVDDCVDNEEDSLCGPTGLCLNTVQQSWLCGLCDEEDSEPSSHTVVVSYAGSPLFTDDGRRLGPAEQDHQSQGGPGKSKHQEYENIDDEFTPEVIERACSNYARFSGIPREAVNAELILERAPSLGINGWADSYLDIRDNGLIQSERRMRERQERSLGGNGDSDCHDIQDPNVQIVKLIVALGAEDNGRRTIFKAMAAKEGIDSQITEGILDGISDRKILVPAYLRSTLQDIGLGEVMAPLNLFEICGTG